MGIEKLRLKGNFYYNLNVLKKGGELKVERRQVDSEKISVDMYGPCIHCFSFLLMKDLWRHTKRCPVKIEKQDEQNEDVQNKKLRFQSEMLLFGSQYQKDRGFYEHLILSMKNDDITFIVKKDPCISRYGSFMFSTHGIAKKWYISQRMRTLGRLLKEIRKIMGNEDYKV